MAAIIVVWHWLLYNGGVLMGAISGILSFVIEDKRGKLWKRLPLVGIIVGMIWGLASTQYTDKENDAKVESNIQAIEDYVRQQTDQVKNLIQVGFGMKPENADKLTPAQAQSAISSANAARTLTEAITPQTRQRLSIALFPHMADDVELVTVQSRLQSIADSVKVDRAFQNIAPTNSVWYSPNGVDFSSAKAAALIVASAGVPIHQICKAKKVTTPGLIQIGGSARAEKELPALSADQIRNLPNPICVEEP